jgi:hypothetical protein
MAMAGGQSSYVGCRLGVTCGLVEILGTMPTQKLGSIVGKTP